MSALKSATIVLAILGGIVVFIVGGIIATLIGDSLKGRF